MHCKINKLLLSLLTLTLALSLAACGSATTPVPAATAAPTAARPVLTTAMGELEIVSVRLADEVHDQPARPGETFLLVTLTQPGKAALAPGEFSLEEFQKMIQDSSGQIYVSGEGNVQAVSTMAGWIDDEFVMGFAVPELSVYSLHWPGNDPLTLEPQGE